MEVTRAGSGLGTYPHGCPFLSRNHLQPPSYGPVLSPMNKMHGGVNKLPSVNQLVGQPPAHSSATAPSLGPMGASCGQWGPGVRWGGPKARPGSTHLPPSGPAPGALHTASSSSSGHGRRHVHRWSPPPLPAPAEGCAQALTVPPAPCRPWDTQQPRPHPAGQRRDERQPQLPVHGLRVPLHPTAPLPRRPQPGQVRGPLLGSATNPLTSAPPRHLVHWPAPGASLHAARAVRVAVTARGSPTEAERMSGAGFQPKARVSLETVPQSP